MRERDGILHAIARLRERHGLIEAHLDAASAAPAPEEGPDFLGSADFAFRSLDSVRMHFIGLDEGDVAQAVSPAAGRALGRLKESLHGIDDKYGRLCGPDRTRGQAVELQLHLADAATKAKAALLAYWREVGGIEPPGIEAFVAAIGRDRVARRGKPAPRADEMTRAVPRVPPPLSTEETVRRARVAAGYAFGRLALLHCLLASPQGAGMGVSALKDVSALEARLCGLGDGLGRRAAAGDGEVVTGLARLGVEVEGLMEAVEGVPGTRDIPDGDLAALRARTLACMRSAAACVREIERLGALRGITLADGGHGPPAPSM